MGHGDTASEGVRCGSGWKAGLPHVPDGWLARNPRAFKAKSGRSAHGIIPTSSIFDLWLQVIPYKARRYARAGLASRLRARKSAIPTSKF
jgi:hypothetical protein